MKEKTECNLLGPMGPVENINQKLFTIVVDGGMAHNIVFDTYTSIGDSDSWSEKHHHQLLKNKDRSDLHHALKLIPSDCEVVHMHGFYGGRDDHFLMNLGEISHFLNITTRPFEINLYKKKSLHIKCFSPGFWQFDYNGVFSLFSFEDNLVKLEGHCLYKSKEEYTKINKYSSHGLSNIGHGLISLACKQPVLVFMNESTTDV